LSKSPITPKIGPNPQDTFCHANPVQVRPFLFSSKEITTFFFLLILNPAQVSALPNKP